MTVITFKHHKCSKVIQT